jgi:hypothetical protein
VICSTCQIFFLTIVTRVLLSGRRIHRLGGFRSGSDRFERRFGGGRRYRCADGMRSLRGGCVIHGALLLRMRPVPGAMIYEQQGKQANGGNGRRNRERPEPSMRMTSILNSIHGDLLPYLVLPNRIRRAGRGSAGNFA